MEYLVSGARYGLSEPAEGAGCCEAKRGAVLDQARPKARPGWRTVRKRARRRGRPPWIVVLAASLADAAVDRVGVISTMR